MTDEEAWGKMDELFMEAFRFETNHPAMITYAIVKMERKRLVSEVKELEAANSKLSKDACLWAVKAGAAKGKAERLEHEKEEIEAALKQLDWAHAEAMALVMSHESHIAKLEAEIARLKEGRESK
jgi:hypothetical protein